MRPRLRRSRPARYVFPVPTPRRASHYARGYVNAIQVWPFTDGALYQVYASPGHVTVVSLQPGEELVTVAAGDTVRWIVGDTSSGSSDALRVSNAESSPSRSGLKTNLVITTSQRTYLLEADLNGKGMDGLGILGLSTRPDAGLAAPVAGGQRRRASRYRPGAGRSASVTRYRAATRRGNRCVPSMTARRSISSFRRALPRASCRRCSSSVCRATGSW